MMNLATRILKGQYLMLNMILEENQSGKDLFIRLKEEK